MKKDKVYQIRTDQEMLDMLTYIQEDFGTKSIAEAIRLCVKQTYDRVYIPDNHETVSRGDVVAPHRGLPGMVIKTHLELDDPTVDIITRTQEVHTYLLRKVEPTGIHWMADEVLKKMRGEPSLYDKGKLR